jgi:hypothetical protein
MKMEGIPFTNIVWEELPGTEIPEERGSSVSRTVQSGDVRVRMLELGAGYRGDHWCSKGHVVLVMEGSLTIVLEDGRQFVTTAGNSFLAGDEDRRHRAETEVGAKVFIVD